jgi:hypothetical protein
MRRQPLPALHTKPAAKGSIDMEYDYERISTLLNIADKTSGHPQLKAIRDAALAELEAIANPPSDDEEEAATAPRAIPAKDLGSDMRRA